MGNGTCGEIGNTFNWLGKSLWLIEVDEGDHLMAEEDLTMRVSGVALAQGDGETAQGLAEAELFSAVAEPALGLDLAHFEAGGYSTGGKSLGKGIGLER